MGAVVGSVNFMAKQIEWPADTVDANGRVWPTVGENIRAGAKNIELTDSLFKSIFNRLYPVGYTYFGEIPTALMSFQTWAPYPVNRDLSGAVISLTETKIRESLDTIVPTFTSDEATTFYKEFPTIIRSGHAFSIPLRMRVI